MPEDHLRAPIKGFKIKAMGIESLKMTPNSANVVVDKKTAETKKLSTLENEKLQLMLDVRNITQMQ